MKKAIVLVLLLCSPSFGATLYFFETTDAGGGTYLWSEDDGGGGANSNWSDQDHDAGFNAHAAPVNGDTVILEAEIDTCTFDEDMSGWANGITLTIESGATLDAYTAAGTYYLMCQADITNNGEMSAGSSGTAYPQTATFTIDFNGGAFSIECTGGGIINFYCTEPTYKFVKLIAQEPIAETVLAVDTDVTGDIWNNGDEVEISEGASYNDTDSDTIAATAAGTITITGGLAAQKEIDSFVTLITRNIRIINSTTYAIDHVDGSVINCAIYDCTHGIEGSTDGGNTIGGAIKCNEATGVALKFIYSSTINAAIAGTRNGLSYCYSSEFSADAVNAGCYYSCLYSRNMVLRGNWCSGIYFVYQSSSIVINAEHFKGYYTAIYQSTDIYIQDTTIDTGLQFTSTVENIIASGCTFQNNTRDLSDATQNGKFYNCTFASGTEFNNYDDPAGRGTWDYVESNDHDGVTNAYRAWVVGGIIDSQTASPPTGYEIWYKLSCKDTGQDYPCFRQFETDVLPGTAIEVTGMIAIPNGEDLSTSGKEPQLQIIDKYADPLKDSTQSPLDYDIPADVSGATTTWQNVSVIWANQGDTPRTVIIRMIAYNDGGVDDVDVSTVWNIADYQDKINTIYNTLIPLRTDVAVSGTATSFTVTDGTATNDIYNNMIVLVQDADDSHWELRNISDWTSGRVLTVDTAFGFTPAVNDLVYIMGTSYSSPILPSTITSIQENTDPYKGYVTGSVYNANFAATGWTEYIDANHICTTAFGGNSFNIFDITIVDRPVLIGQLIDNTYLSGAEDIYIDSDSDVAYVTSVGYDGIVCIDISDLTNPTIVANGYIQDHTYLDGAETLDVKDYGDSIVAVVGALNGDYVTTVKIDDPTSMSILDYVNDAALLEEPIYVLVEGDYAFVSSRLKSKLLSISIADPNNISIADDIQAYQPTGIEIDSTGDVAYIATQMFDGVYSFDISDPTSMSQLDTVGDTSKMDGARILELVGNVLAVTGYNINSVALVDVSDNTDMRVMSGYCIDDTLLNTADDIRWFKNRFFVTARYGSRLSVVRFPFLEIDYGQQIYEKLPDDNIMGSSVTTSKDDEIDAILADTDEIQTDQADGGRLDVIWDAIKYKTDLISVVDTVVKDANDANNFTIEDGTDVNDAFWFMAIIVEDADDNTSKEIRWIDVYKENSGDPNIWVDNPFSFTPAVDDVVHIMGTCYGGYLYDIVRGLRQTRGVLNVIDNTDTVGSYRAGVTAIDAMGNDP